jgi:hypothetical protein
MVPTPDRSVTIRLASDLDQSAIARVAALDSSAPPAWPVLLAEVDDRLLAALSLSDGSAVADPFHPTADLIALLSARARQLGDQTPAKRPSRSRSWSWLLAPARR